VDFSAEVSTDTSHETFGKGMATMSRHSSSERLRPAGPNNARYVKSGPA